MADGLRRYRYPPFNALCSARRLPIRTIRTDRIANGGGVADCVL